MQELELVDARMLVVHPLSRGYPGPVLEAEGAEALQHAHRVAEWWHVLGGAIGGCDPALMVSFSRQPVAKHKHKNRLRLRVLKRETGLVRSVIIPEGIDCVYGF